jgi:RNA polymerase sigma-70 factor (ECF subfamily)
MSLVVNGAVEVAEPVDATHVRHELPWFFASNLARPAAGPSKDDEDHALLARIARHEVGSLRVLYDQHARRAMAIAMRVLRNESEAEEVVQETFLEIWRRADRFDQERGTAAAWVGTIARSRAIDRLRSSVTSSRAIEGASATPVQPELLPNDLAERRHDEARVAAALGELPAEQRQTIELAYFEGLSQSEIAKKTGSPLGTVKMRVKLAMSKLAKLLKTDEDTHALP